MGGREGKREREREKGGEIEGGRREKERTVGGEDGGRMWIQAG